MPKDVGDAYDELKQDLIKLRTNLNSSVYNHFYAVTNCCTMIKQLLAETYLQYHELDGGKRLLSRRLSFGIW